MSRWEETKKELGETKGEFEQTKRNLEETKNKKYVKNGEKIRIEMRLDRGKQGIA